MAASRDLVQAKDSISWISGSLYYDQIRTGVRWMLAEKYKQAVCVLAQATAYGREVQQAVRDQLALAGQSTKALVTKPPPHLEFNAPETMLVDAGWHPIAQVTEK